jgi:TetR/AcrR family acrAB operon transcriptional repressor
MAHRDPADHVSLEGQSSTRLKATKASGRPKTKKEALSEQSKARLMAAAARLFSEQGFKATSIEQIAQAAGISRGSIYWHFGSKAQLLLAVADEAFQTWAQQWEDRDDMLQTGLNSVVKATLARVRHPEARLLPMLLFEALSRPKSALRSRYADRYEISRQRLRALLVRAQRRGELRDDVEPSLAATVIWASLVGLSLQWRLDPDHVDLQGAYSALPGLLSRGLLVDSPRESSVESEGNGADDPPGQVSVQGASPTPGRARDE